MSVQTSSFKIVAFGNSLTARSDWPSALQNAMSTCLAGPISVEVIADVGVTSTWAVNNVNRVIAAAPQVILMQFSENDAAINNIMSVDSSRTNIARVLGALRQGVPAARIVYMAMNPPHGFRGWMRPFLASYIEAHRQEAERRNVTFVDFRPHWNTLTNAEIALHIPDGLHPTTSKVSEIMVPVLLAHLVPDKDCRPHRSQ